MKKLLRLPTILCCSLFFLLLSCSDEREIYYSRPDWLNSPIYETLKNEGRFTNYLKCVDRTMYAATLKASGMFTVFAPNDDAFSTYLVSKNLNSVDQLPDSIVNKIVSYSIVYNKFVYDHLADVLSGGWDTLSCIKKKTTYYETIHQETYKGKTIWVYNMPSFSVGDNNNKFVPLYLKSVFEKSRTQTQAADDYAMFYPTVYTGQNIQSASILEKDMLSENGVVHEVDQVNEPLPSIEQYLSDPTFSMFKALINTKNSTGDNYFVNYTYSKTATDYFKQALPGKSIDEVYLKSYQTLAFNMNSERYGSGNLQAEQGGYTLFAPTNQAIQAFYNDKLKDYFPNGIETVSKDVLSYFINAQMIPDLVWPGDYKGTVNSSGEFLNGKGNRGDAFDKNKYTKILPASNGFFYGGDSYIKSRYFETVFTEIFLNSSYKFLNYAFSEYFTSTLKEELLRCELNGYTQENYTILMPSDDLLKADGFDWTWISGSSKYGFTNSNAGSAIGNFDLTTRMQRLVKSHIFKRLKNDEINSALTTFTTDASFVSAYGGYSFAVNEYGDMIRYKDGKIQMLGNYDDNEWVTATLYKTFSNGQVFTIDKMLQYSPRKTYPNQAEGYKSNDLWVYILNMVNGTSQRGQNTNVALFRNYMEACLKGSESNELAGLSADQTYTIFMPTNTAITKAIANGDLPTLTNVRADVVARQKATSFILYHILKGKEIVDDGLTYLLPNKEKVTEEVWPTALKDVVDNTYLSVRKDVNGNLLVSTQYLKTGTNLSQTVKTATVVRGATRSNYFGARAVIHEINDYVVYKKTL